MTEKIKKIIGIVLLVFWACLLISLTILSRPLGIGGKIELQLFWCIKEAWTFHSTEDWYFIIGNILLFVPLGFIIPTFFDKLRVTWKAVLIGAIVSFLVELVQLILKCGLSELDDLFNNTLGCFLGYCIFIIFQYCFTKKKDKRRLSIAIISWIFVVAFFVVAYCMGQPIEQAILYMLERIRNVTSFAEISLE